MNKVVLAILMAVFAVASASVFRLPTAQSPLEKKVEKIVSLIPFPKVGGIIAGYVDSGDPEVRELVEFVKSGKLQDLVTQIISMPQVQAQLQELETKGIHVQEHITFIKGLIHRSLPDADKIEKVTPTSRGLAGMYKQILSAIPISQILAEGIIFAMTNDEVNIIWEQVRSKECYEAAREVLAREDVKEDLEKLRLAGLDVDAFIKEVEGLLGWSSRT